MLLAIDARNRTVTVGIRDGRTWRTVRKLGAFFERTADEYAMLFRDIASDAGALKASGSPGGVRGAGIEAVWISCVVPALAPRLGDAVRSAFGLVPGTVGPGVRTGVKIRTEIPSEVGSDLICAAVAARELMARDGAPKACVIVDFGSAVTFSSVNSLGEFMGAAIAPGVETAAEALRAKAAQIPDVRLEPPGRAIGRTTAQAVQAGILLGYGGLVSRLVELQREELGEESEVIGTGDAIGNGIMQACGFGRFQPELVLDGLAAIAIRNP